MTNTNEAVEINTNLNSTPSPSKLHDLLSAEDLAKLKLLAGNDQ